jgi:hypothetical protein
VTGGVNSWKREENLAARRLKYLDLRRAISKKYLWQTADNRKSKIDEDLLANHDMAEVRLASESQCQEWAVNDLAHEQHQRKISRKKEGDTRQPCNRHDLIGGSTIVHLRFCSVNIP